MGQVRAARVRTARVQSLTGGVVGLALAVSMTGWAAAHPGDILAVTAERVNLRAGPSDEANVRGTVAGGDELVEIRREGDWIGVRSLASGAEGWIYGDLVETVLASAIGGDDTVALGPAPRAGAFRTYSQSFDRLVADIGRRIGTGLFDEVAVDEDGALRLTPSTDFLINSGRDAHMLAALAAQQMYKNYENGRPVSVVMLGQGGGNYIRLSDAGRDGPVLDIAGPDRQGDRR